MLTAWDEIGGGTEAVGDDLGHRGQGSRDIKEQLSRKQCRKPVVGVVVVSGEGLLSAVLTTACNLVSCSCFFLVGVEVVVPGSLDTSPQAPRPLHKRKIQACSDAQYMRTFTGTAYFAQ